MRAERWWQETSVIADLVEQPTAYEFIQATRLLRVLSTTPKRSFANTTLTLRPVTSPTR